MRVLSGMNSLGTKSSTAVSSELVPKVEAFELYQRKTRAHKIVADSKQYISSQILTEELKEHIDALKEQENTLSTFEAIVMMLDYAEREFLAIKKLEKGDVRFMGISMDFFKILF